MNGSENRLLEGRMECVTCMLHRMSGWSMLPWFMCEWSISMIPGVRIADNLINGTDKM